MCSGHIEGGELLAGLLAVCSTLCWQPSAPFSTKHGTHPTYLPTPAKKQTDMPNLPHESTFPVRFAFLFDQGAVMDEQSGEREPPYFLRREMAPKLPREWAETSRRNFGSRVFRSNSQLGMKSSSPNRGWCALQAVVPAAHLDSEQLHSPAVSRSTEAPGSAFAGDVQSARQQIIFPSLSCFLKEAGDF